jgi:lipopolysaccharide export system protein LptC
VTATGMPRRSHIPSAFLRQGPNRRMIESARFRAEEGEIGLTTASEAAERPGWRASSRSDLERMFRVAARHSRHVRLLRIVTPLFVVLLIALFALATWFNPLRLIAKLPSAAGKLAISGTKITMELPRIAGYTRDARAYELSARSADQDLTRPENVELKEIAAKVELQNNGVLELSATSGVYNTKVEQLRLGESVVLKSSSGYEARLTEALIDMHNGHITSEHPVEVKLLNGVLNARGLEVVDSGDLVRFSGGVAMTLDLAREATGSVGGSRR